MVDQGLDVGEDTLGVGLVAHDHHVLHLQQRHAVDAGPEGASGRGRQTGGGMRRAGRAETSSSDFKKDEPNENQTLVMIR